MSEEKKQESVINEEMVATIKELEQTVSNLKNELASRGYDIGGKAEAGIIPKAEDPETAAEKEAMKLLEGTGLTPFRKR